METMIAAIIFAMAALGIYAMLFRAYQLSALARYRDDARAVLETFADQFERLQAADLVYTNGDTGNTSINMSGLTYQSSTGNLINSSGNVAHTDASGNAITYPITQHDYTRELFTLVSKSSPTGNGLQGSNGTTSGGYWNSTSQEVSPANLDSNSTAVLAWPTTGDTSLHVTIGGTSLGTQNSITAYVTRYVEEMNADSPGYSGAVLSAAKTYAAGQLLRATFTITYSVYGRSVTQTLSVLRLSP